MDHPWQPSPTQKSSMQLFLNLRSSKPMQRWLHVGISLFTIVVFTCLSGCDAPKNYKNIITPEILDVAPEKLPLKGYRGILFTMSKDDLTKQFGCNVYELTVGCDFYDGSKVDTAWVVFNEAGRIVFIKKDLGYFNQEVAQEILNRFNKKFPIASEPSPFVLNSYNIGLKDTLSYVYADGQVVFQIGRSYNKRNQLVNIFYFPPDIGASFLESVPQ